VHGLFEGGTDRPWEAGEKRINKLVFIGKNLNKEELESSFQDCLLP
jgi:G3E family GTPase